MTVDFGNEDLEMLATSGLKCSIYGAFAAVVEGHKGLKAYDKDKIVFVAKNKCVCVLGNKLTIKQFFKGYALIVGQIDGIVFEQ